MRDCLKNLLKIGILVFLFSEMAFSELSLQAQDYISKLNYLKNTDLYKKAQSGERESQYKLGLIYYYGDNKTYVYSFEDGRNIMVRDLREAYFWLEKASQAGHVDSMYHFSLLNLRNPDGDFKLGDLGASSEQALFFLEKAADQDHNLSQFELFKIYKEAGDKRTADEWLKKAADGGHIVAQYDLARIDFYSENPTDQQKAIDWFFDTAYSNTGKFGIYSIMHLADAYQRAKGDLEEDLLEAYAWKSLYVEYYPACNDSESFRQSLLDDSIPLDKDRISEAVRRSDEIKREIERSSKSRLLRQKLDCPD